MDLALEGRFQLNFGLDFAIVEEVEPKFRSLIIPGHKLTKPCTEELRNFALHDMIAKITFAAHVLDVVDLVAVVP